MSKDEIRKLLGGYATDTLTAEEQRLLFEAAMEDQELFDALAEEQSLRELMADPAARRELREALEPEQTVWARFVAWWRRPSRLVLAGGLAVAVIATIAVRNITETREYQQVAVQKAPAPAAEVAVAPESKPAEPQAKRDEPRAARGRRDAGAVEDLAKSKTVEQDQLAVADARKADQEVRVLKEEAQAAPPPPPAPARESVAITAAAPLIQQQAPQKLRVAVLNFNSVQGAKQQPDPALTKDLAERLNQAPTQYALVDQNEVNRVLSEKKLSNQALDSQTAASVGRSLGADAVIVGNVAQQQAPQASGVVGGVPGFRQQQQPRAMARGKVEDKGQQQAITAQVIDTRNAANQFTTSADNVDRVAAQLAQFKVEGAVTDVNASVLTINIGAPAGVKAGDRFQVVRADDVLGQLRISSVGASYAVGVFTGTSTPQAGDLVRRLLD